MVDKFRIDVIDMYLRDQRALAIIQERVNPETRRTSIKVQDLADALQCHYTTALKIVARLEGAGHIKSSGTRGRFGGTEFEVLTTQDEHRPA